MRERCAPTLHRSLVSTYTPRSPHLFSLSCPPILREVTETKKWVIYEANTQTYDALVLYVNCCFNLFLFLGKQAYCRLSSTKIQRETANDSHATISPQRCLDDAGGFDHARFQDPFNQTPR